MREQSTVAPNRFVKPKPNAVVRCPVERDVVETAL